MQVDQRAENRAGRPRKTLDQYVNGFIVKDSQLFKGNDGQAVEALRCSICTTKFRVTEATRDKSEAIRDHLSSQAHQQAARAHTKYLLYLAILFFPNSHQVFLAKVH
jgi:hypothetical protein